MSDKHYTHHDDRTHLESALRKTAPWFEANATFLIYGLAAILAVAAAIVWVRRQPQENSEVSALWQNAQQPEDFQTIADEYGDINLGRLARLQQAETLLNSAIPKMFTDRAAASLELEQAEAALNRLTDLGDLDSYIAERILIGKARLAEVRCDGTDASIAAVTAAWQEVLDENEGSIAREMVERRIARLGEPDTAAFYVWFHGLDPKPEDDLTLPGMPGGTAPGPGTAVPDIPAAEMPLNLPSFDFDTPTDSGAPDSDSADTDPTSEPGDDGSESGTDASDETSETSGEAAGEEEPGDSSVEIEETSSESASEESAEAPEEADAGE